MYKTQKGLYNNKDINNDRKWETGILDSTKQMSSRHQVIIKKK